jgi:hypothetical protein
MRRTLTSWNCSACRTELSVLLEILTDLDRRTAVGEMHVASEIPYVYDYVIKLCRTQAEVILNYRNAIVRGTG